MLNSINKKLIVSASVVAAALFVSGCTEGAAPADSMVKKPSIDGGVYYPIANGKTGPYLVNEQAHTMALNNGREATANELKAWDKDIQGAATGNRGLPEGSGSVEDGEALYEAQCVMCHGDFGSGGGGYPALSKGSAYNLQKTLKNQRNIPDNDGPVRVFGSYWPEASTMFWYIRDAMPHTKSKTLTDDETYALTAYILHINEMKIDGEEVDYEYVLDAEKFRKIKMPNKDGFEPNIEGPTALEDVRKYYQNPANFGGKKVKPEERCMTNCQTPTAEIVRIQHGGISEFNPPMSVERNLPVAKADGAHKVSFDAAKAYEEACVMCHGSFAPAAGDKAAWAPYMEKGMAALYKNGIEGTEMGMPAMGGSSLTEDEFKSVVDYMVDFK